MIKLLRHDPSIPRGDDGAVRFDDCMEEFKAKFDGTSLVWQREEDQRKGSKIAGILTPPCTFCFSGKLRDIQEVISLILHCKTLYWYQRTSSSTSVTWSGGWVPQGMRETGGGGPVRVPNLGVCKHFNSGWRLVLRGTVQSEWQKPSS